MQVMSTKKTTTKPILDFHGVPTKIGDRVVFIDKGRLSCQLGFGRVLALYGSCVAQIVNERFYHEGEYTPEVFRRKVYSQNFCKLLEVDGRLEVPFPLPSTPTENQD